QLPPIATLPMSVHIGFHHGPVLSDESGDVFGDTVNLAARLSKLATRGQIITSRNAVEHLPAGLRQMTRHLYPIRVRGKEPTVELFEALWQHNAELTVMASASPNSSRSALLTLRYRETLLELNAASLPVT